MFDPTQESLLSSMRSSASLNVHLIAHKWATRVQGAAINTANSDGVLLNKNDNVLMFRDGTMPKNSPWLLELTHLREVSSHARLQVMAAADAVVQVTQQRDVIIRDSSFRAYSDILESRNMEFHNLEGPAKLAQGKLAEFCLYLAYNGCSIRKYVEKEDHDYFLPLDG